jgi:pimeloyl-ACP methyl ester carboxylesterase
MDTVTSKDGTTIAYDQVGAGPPVILVAGALGDRKSQLNADLAAHLAPHFTAITYDRRGKGDSGDTLPYAVEREIEDLDALIDAVGGSAALYGISSGAVLALAAGNALPGKVTRLALYEPPFIVDDSRPPLPADYVQQINDLVAADRRGDAVALFMRQVGVPDQFIGQMRAMPMWPGMEHIAHTLAYDGLIMGDNQTGRPLAPGQWPAATMPALVIVGGNSPPFFHTGTRALVEQLPHAQHATLPGQTHEVAAAALAPVLIEFFAA